MRLVRRSAWGARRPKATASRLSSTRGVKVHYTGDLVDVRLKDADGHSRCVAKVRSIQDSHMDGNGWNDIGYSALVCPHGYVFEGRGLHALPAANGEGLNSGHYAVCGLVGNKGLVEPTNAMLNGIRDAIEWFREEGNAGTEIKGHRDGYSTDCPGPHLYPWVKAGAPRPAGGEDDMDPKTDVVISPYYKDPVRNQFDKDVYDAGFLWTGAVAETRIYGKKILAAQEGTNELIKAQGVTIAALSTALQSASIMTAEQAAELQATISGAFNEAVQKLDGIRVSLEVNDEEESSNDH